MGVVNGCSLGDGTTNDATYFSSAKAFAAELPAENRGIRTPAIQFRVSVLSEGEIKRGWALRGALAFTSRRNSSVVRWGHRTATTTHHPRRQHGNGTSNFGIDFIFHRQQFSLFLFFAAVVAIVVVAIAFAIAVAVTVSVVCG